MRDEDRDMVRMLLKLQRSELWTRCLCLARLKYNAAPSAIYKHWSNVHTFSFWYKEELICDLSRLVRFVTWLFFCQLPDYPHCKGREGGDYVRRKAHLREMEKILSFKRHIKEETLRATSAQWNSLQGFQHNAVSQAHLKPISRTQRKLTVYVGIISK